MHAPPGRLHAGDEGDEGGKGLVELPGLAQPAAQCPLGRRGGQECRRQRLAVGPRRTLPAQAGGLLTQHDAFESLQGVQGGVVDGVLGEDRVALDVIYARVIVDL